METRSLKDEFLKLNNFSIEIPTVSAFVQARSKIKVEAFKILFDYFNKMTHKDKLYKDDIDNTVYGICYDLLKCIDRLKWMKTMLSVKWLTDVMNHITDLNMSQDLDRRLKDIIIRIMYDTILQSSEFDINVFRIYTLKQK